MTQTSIKKNLLVAAHKGEVAPFIAASKAFIQDSTDPLGIKRGRFFKNESASYDIFICGEGRQKATENLGLFLGQDFDKYQSLYSIGFSGALHLGERCELGKVYKVGSSFAQKSGEEMEYRSFSVSERKNKYFRDVVTALGRVDSKKPYFETLGNFADLVDRETWAIGSLAYRCKLRFYGARLVSDLCLAGSCNTVRMHQVDFAESLFDFVKKHLEEIEKVDAQSDVSGKSLKNCFPELTESNNFYFTHSMRERLHSLQFTCVISGDHTLRTVSKLAESLAVNENLSRKQRSLTLLAEMEKAVMAPLLCRAVEAKNEFV